jgi:hypothetical protein
MHTIIISLRKPDAIQIWGLFFVNPKLMIISHSFNGKIISSLSWIMPTFWSMQSSQESSRIQELFQMKYNRKLWILQLKLIYSQSDQHNFKIWSTSSKLHIANSTWKNSGSGSTEGEWDYFYRSRLLY